MCIRRSTYCMVTVNIQINTDLIVNTLVGLENMQIY